MTRQTRQVKKKTVILLGNCLRDIRVGKLNKKQTAFADQPPELGPRTISRIENCDAVSLFPTAAVAAHKYGRPLDDIIDKARSPSITPYEVATALAELGALLKHLALPVPTAPDSPSTDGPIAHQRLPPFR